MNHNDVSCITMQSLGGAIVAWAVIVYVLWQLFRLLRKRAGGSVATAIAGAEAAAEATGGQAQAGVIVNVYLASDPRHGTADTDGVHVSVPDAIESSVLPSLPVARPQSSPVPRQRGEHVGRAS